MDRKLLKQNAKANFKKRWGDSIVITLIMYGAGTVLSLLLLPVQTGEPTESTIALIMGSSLITIAFSLLVLPIFQVGCIRFFQKLRMNVPTGIGEVTGNFKDGNFKNIVLTNLIMYIKIYLWTLLFIIPGIIKTYEYRLIPYILAVRPGIDRKEAFRLSKVLMDGYKWKSFVLDLSFWGWNILAAYTMGILGIVYVYPYMNATYVEFYSFTRAMALQKGLIPPMDLPDYEPPMQNGFGMNNGFGFNPQQQGYQNQYQQPPYQNPYNQGYQQNPYQQPFAPQQPTQQAPFWQETNQPVGNVETMPNEQPVSEDEAKEVEFKPVDEE